MEHQQQRKQSVGIMAGVAVILLVGMITLFSESSARTSAADISSSESAATADSTALPKAAPSTLPSSTLPPAIKPKSSALVYKDGTYTATGSYSTHDGNEQITITLTLTNDIITAISAVKGAHDYTSDRYQNMFISGCKPLVMGKNIATLKLTKVSGSSLTPIGFNDAISQIRTVAKS